jgi:hypothetical protein
VILRWQRYLVRKEVEPPKRLKLATLTKISAVKPPTTTPGTNATSPSPSPSPAPTHHGHTGAIVGGVLSGIVGVAIILATLCCFFRRRRRRQQASAGHVSYVYELPSQHKHELEHPPSEMADPASDPASEMADPVSETTDSPSEMVDPAVVMYAGHVAAYWQKSGLIR